MAQEIIRDDRGRSVGYKNSNGFQIEYRHYTGGLIGTYNKTTKQYQRFKPELGPALPITKEDFGLSDVLAYDKLHKV